VNEAVGHRAALIVALLLVGSLVAPLSLSRVASADDLSVTGTASSTTIDAGQSVDFACTPSGGSESGYTFLWDFGDELGTSDGQYPSYEYDIPGSYTATVTVTDDLEETAHWSVDIRVYDVHNPIVILSNDDFTLDNGVVSGSGTIDDPFIIEGWGIDASSSGGIDIENADSYFIVRDCHVHDGGSGYVGIYLYNCVNGILSDNVCTDNYDGIYLEDSGGITISYNDCSFNSRHGIVLYSSSANIIRNNTLDSNSNIGIFLQQSSNSNTISNNTCSNANYGICLSSSSGNTVHNNTCSSSYFAGMRLSLSSGNTLSNNTCSNNYIGIILQRSNSNALSNNTCSSNDEYGIYLYASSNSNTLRDNNCSSNDYNGINLASSSSNEMTRNQLCDNAEYGIRMDSGSGSNTIWRSTFIDNNAANVQAYDDGTDNQWYSPGTPHGYGNYWNDWTTPDTDSNSIVDDPYTIEGSSASQDIYPLTIPEDLLTKTIKGQVRDEMDTPIPGAQVGVTIKNGEVVIVTKTTTTDAEGYYAVTFDQDEWSIGYTIEVTAQYGEQQTETIEADGSTVQTVDIQFPFAISQFGSALGFLLAGALVGVIATIFLTRRRRG